MLRELAPANDPPRWRRIEAEALRRGFSSTRAFRTWCLSRKVPLREDNHRDTWVEPAAVDAAVELLPAVEPPKAKPGASVNDFDRELYGPGGAPLRPVG